MLTFTDETFKRAIQDDTGIKPPWSTEAFTDLEEDVRQSMARIAASPFIPRKDSVRGFVFDLATGQLNEVSKSATGRSWELGLAPSGLRQGVALGLDNR
jgi:carbonic anhydrase